MRPMTQTAFRTDQLSPELNHLINDYPRDAWDAHPNFVRSTQNWLGAHQAFRQLSDMCVSKTEHILDKNMDAEHYGHILGRYGDSLVRNLHGIIHGKTDSFSPNWPVPIHGLRQVWTCLSRITKSWMKHWIALPARPIGI